MTELAGKTCTPCRGGVPPLDRAAAERYLREAPGWALHDAGKRIERKFQLKNFNDRARPGQPDRRARRGRGPSPGHHFRLGLRGVSLHTHKIKGLHENDFIMATKINRMAEG